MFNRRCILSGAVCATIATIDLASSQSRADMQDPPAYPLKFLNRTEYPGDKYVCILVKLDLAPGQLVPRHMHPGVESSYLSLGSVTLSVKGQPDLVVKAGDGYQVPPEVPHTVRNGPEKSTIIATFIVEKDKPLVQPVPE
jgi:quercetin dioxygenase-like cupin family protein